MLADPHVEDKNDPEQGGKTLVEEHKLKFFNSIFFVQNSLQVPWHGQELVVTIYSS